MISNNLALLAQNIKTKYNPIKKEHATNPQRRIAIKHKFQAKIRQSHVNLFNFINDNSSIIMK